MATLKCTPKVLCLTFGVHFNTAMRAFLQSFLFLAITLMQGQSPVLRRVLILLVDNVVVEEVFYSGRIYQFGVIWIA